MISPSLVTYHRRLLHDALVLVLTLGSVLCFHAARAYPSNTRDGRLARFGMVGPLSLFLCTKANAFFIILMLFSFWVASFAQRFWRRTNAAKSSRWLAAIPLAMLRSASHRSPRSANPPT
ncbi:MAG: hypothetical protein WKF84_20135 [Pyrinomonadaceae bacterium]